MSRWLEGLSSARRDKPVTAEAAALDSKYCRNPGNDELISETESINDMVLTHGENVQQAELVSSIPLDNAHSLHTNTTSVDDVLSTAKFEHFSNAQDAAENRDRIGDYEKKKREADSVMLRTRRQILDTQRDNIDYNNLIRHYRNFDTNQTEIYEWSMFADCHLNGLSPEDKERILGFHDVCDDKICLRIPYDDVLFKKTAIHEEIHNDAFHGAFDIRVPDGNEHTAEVRCLQSGLHTHAILLSGDREYFRAHFETDVGRAINEGVTEAFALDEMIRQKEATNDWTQQFGSYTREVGWTRRIMHCVGRDTVERAYFAGDYSELRCRVTEKTGDTSLWDRLIRTMDERLASRNIEEKCRLAEEINRMINQMDM